MHIVSAYSFDREIQIIRSWLSLRPNDFYEALCLCKLRTKSGFVSMLQCLPRQTYCSWIEIWTAPHTIQFLCWGWLVNLRGIWHATFSLVLPKVTILWRQGTVSVRYMHVTSTSYCMALSCVCFAYICIISVIVNLHTVQNSSSPQVRNTWGDARVLSLSIQGCPTPLYHSIQSSCPSRLHAAPWPNARDSSLKVISHIRKEIQPSCCLKWDRVDVAEVGRLYVRKQ